MAESQTPENAGAAAATATTPDPNAPQKPANIPDKFWNAEKAQVRVDDLAKSYSELEKKQSQAAAGKPPPDQPLGIPKDDAIDDNAGIEELVRSVGLDSSKIAREFLEKGKLSVEDYAAFRKKGITRGIVDQYMGIQVSLYRQAQESVVVEAAKILKADKEADGGKGKVGTILAWAKDNLSAAERAFYDKMAASPDTAIRGFEWLVGKHAQSVGAGKTQPLITGEAAPASTGGFASQAEAHKAQNDPRYTSDPAYKAAVDARIGATDMRVIMGAI